MAVIVITGGTAGVGKATALHFAKAGYDVGIIARDEQSLRSTEEELRRFDQRVCRSGRRGGQQGGDRCC